MAEVPHERSFCGELEQRLDVRGIRLERLQSNCVSKAYRATLPDGRVLFTKLAKVDSAKTRAFLRAAAPSPILPESVEAGAFPLDGRWASTYVWRESEHVPLERMNDAQFEAFWTACRRLQPLLQEAPVVDPRIDCEALMDEIRAYAARFPLCGRLLAPLLSLRREDYVHSAATPEVTIHGDFHVGNFGFTGDAFAYFCDFDLMARGAEVDDLAFLLAERMKRFDMGRRGFVRLGERARQLVARAGRPVAEWRVALNILRIRAAARLISRHPDRRRTVLNVLSRDRRLRKLLRILRNIDTWPSKSDECR